MKLPGYHIPKAEVRLLSPQVIYKLVGGHGRQTGDSYQLRLGDGTRINAPYCPWSNLLIIDLLAPEVRWETWEHAFVYSSSVLTKFSTGHCFFGAKNTNLSALQKEALLRRQ